MKQLKSHLFNLNIEYFIHGWAKFSAKFPVDRGYYKVARVYHIISYHIISYHIISYHIISYHVISYH